MSMMDRMKSKLKGVFREPSAHDLRYDHDREYLDPTPVALPVNMTRPPTLAEQVARLVRSEKFADEARKMGMETFDEADDFEIENDDLNDPSTPYERDFDIAALQASDKGYVQPPVATRKPEEILSKYSRKKRDLIQEEPSKEPKRPPKAGEGDE